MAKQLITTLRKSRLIQIPIELEAGTKVVKRSELANHRMAAGNEDKLSTVIVDGVVKQWVAIGWIGDTAAKPGDYKKYPVAIDDEV